MSPNKISQDTFFVTILEAAICVATDDASNKHTRHSKCDFYITNESLFQGKKLPYHGTKNQLADISTKPIGPDLFPSQCAPLFS